MHHAKTHRRFNRRSDHRRSMLANLAASRRGRLEEIHAFGSARHQQAFQREPIDEQLGAGLDEVPWVPGVRTVPAVPAVPAVPEVRQVGLTQLSNDLCRGLRGDPLDGTAHVVVADDVADDEGVSRE